MFFRATADALNPFSPGASTAAEPAAQFVAGKMYNDVVKYAAGRPNYLGGIGLMYPMKSSVVRAGLARIATVVESTPLVGLDLAIVQGLWIESNAFAAGHCR